jgi:catechol 2,3-dioxygenase
VSAGAPALPAGTAIGRVRLRVRDIPRSLAFYRDLLGLRVYAEDDGTVALAAPGAAAPLVLLHQDSAARPRPDRVPGLYHYAILLPDRLDLGRTMLRLFERRWPFHGFADHGVSEAAYLADPDGNGIELAADRPRAQWPRKAGRLAMTTLALNVNDLLRRVDGESARELPPDTRIGHVHLHVADLPPAERFYHDVLGFDVTERNYPGALFLAAGGYHHHIAVNTWIAGPAPPGPIAGLIDYAIELPDAEGLNSVLERLRAAGVEPEAVAEGFRVADAGGNGVLLATATSLTARETSGSS